MESWCYSTATSVHIKHLLVHLRYQNLEVGHPSIQHLQFILWYTGSASTNKPLPHAIGSRRKYWQVWHPASSGHGKRSKATPH
mmetsp:Transcript_4881/g.6738  ORF Transcript_4881/g.6738 Transcript_4881/m.6738 type:complete len:83 (+) Transcript_4881:409-657(+)